jgi:two-component system phosphate regulon sensor histidine kinase PhoR
VTLRTRTLLSTLAGAAVAVLVVTVLASTLERRLFASRIEADLVARTRLAAELLSTRPVAPSVDEAADALASLTGARVTFIDARGAVTGDSELDSSALASVENHGDRPEVIDARGGAIGRARRYSRTAHRDMLYAAAAVRGSPIAVVRLSLPLATVQEQLAPVWRTSLLALGAGLLAALALSWATSQWLTTRVRAIASVARRYAEGDLSRPTRDYGDDEIGQVARVLDNSVQEIGRRLEESRRTRSHMEAILESMFEGVVLVDGNGRLLLANTAAREMLHMPDAAEGRHYLELIRQPDVDALLERALAGTAASQLEVTLGRDPRRAFAARTAPVDGPAGSGAVLVLHDITDLRRVDQIRRDFVANVSHELRTPLTAVKGYVEALADGSASAEQRPRFLDIISRHTLRMERLVDDLLRLARLEAGQEPLETSRLALGPVIGAIVAELESEIRTKRIQVRANIDAGAAAVTGDPAKIHDALRNVIENAVHYGVEGTAVDISSHRDADRVVVDIADRGPGIPEDDLSRIFERFYRVDRSRTQDPGGTGLGLAIAKHLIGLHGGTIAAGNREGGGSVFTIRLPA